MANIDVFKDTEIYSWLDVDMVFDGGAILTIASTEIEEVEMSRPPYKSMELVIGFCETPRKFILSNKANTRPIVRELGKMTGSWIDAKLHLLATEITVKGEKVWTIRVASVTKPKEEKKDDDV